MRRPAAAHFLWTALLVLTPGVGSAQGLFEGLTMVLDTNVGTTTTRTTQTATGAVTTQTFDTLFPRFTVNADTMLSPNLRLSLGGVIESDMLFAQGEARDTTATKIRPFVELRSTSEVLAPGFGYYRREDRTQVEGLPRIDLVNEDYAAYLSWRPAGLPQTDFQFVRTNTFNPDRDLLDTTKDFGSIVSRYAYKGLNVYYQGSSLDTADRAHGVDTEQVSNAIRADYSRSFNERRGLWNMSYNVGHLRVTTEATGEGGEVALPQPATRGLSALSDTPVTERLTPNPPLIDANLTAGAGVNLGLPPVGADARARNIGLDFLNPTEVNRFHVWIDRELPPEIANTFSWELYSSPDNLLWTRETAVASARFGPFENRFQLDFRPVTARYLKVVVRPLSAAVTDAARYPDILVTELQAFLTQAAEDARSTLARTSQTFNTDLRYRLLDVPQMYYEGSYWYNDAGIVGSDRQFLSNGVSVNHRVRDVLGIYGRGALEVGREPEGQRWATVTNASLTYDAISTFTASLLYTGRNEEVGDRARDQQGISVQTNSQVYRGVDVQVGVGWNVQTRDTGEELHDRFLNVAGTLVPRPNLNLTLSYANTSTERTGVFVGEPRYNTNRMFATLSWDPVRTLHLSVSQEVVSSDTERARNFTNVGVNWSPFQDGTLQFYVTYNESLRPLEDGTERNVRPGLRWSFSRRSYLDVAYENYRTEFKTQTTETEVVSANVRIFF